jgi:hypothetical protein
MNSWHTKVRVRQGQGGALAEAFFGRMSYYVGVFFRFGDLEFLRDLM